MPGRTSQDWKIEAGAGGSGGRNRYCPDTARRLGAEAQLRAEQLFLYLRRTPTLFPEQIQTAVRKFYRLELRGMGLRKVGVDEIGRLSDPGPRGAASGGRAG